MPGYEVYGLLTGILFDPGCPRKLTLQLQGETNSKTKSFGAENLIRSHQPIIRSNNYTLKFYISNTGFYLTIIL